MQSSPYLPSSMPNQDSPDSLRIASIILAREEDLEGKPLYSKNYCRYRFANLGDQLRADAKSTFQSISVIHVYSVQPNVLQDLNVLTDVAREVATAHAQEDPLEFGKQWGMIQNRNVKV